MITRLDNVNKREFAVASVYFYTEYTSTALKFDRRDTLAESSHDLTSFPLRTILSLGFSKISNSSTRPGGHMNPNLNLFHIADFFGGGVEKTKQLTYSRIEPRSGSCLMIYEVHFALVRFGLFPIVGQRA